MTTRLIPLFPITHSSGVKSISDDDLCATCSHCDYKPGEMSGCREGWPGEQDRDDYVLKCPSFKD